MRIIPKNIPNIIKITARIILIIEISKSPIEKLLYRKDKIWSILIYLFYLNYLYISCDFFRFMRFAHLADCHLGGWRQPELRQLNLDSFKKAIDICIERRVNFVIIAGDLFDSAYPPIEILEEAFFHLKRLKDARISCYIIAGSHDYSASGRTFLNVLEKAGFCKNLYNVEEKYGKLFLNPTIHENVALYGYPGKKSGLEVNELRNVKLQDSPFFKIFALHTSIREALGNLPIDAIAKDELPEADYYALGHLHIDFLEERMVYGGPVFPNNFQELEELKYGRFYIIETTPFKTERIDLQLKDIEVFEMEISNAMIVTDIILRELKKRKLKDKILLLKLYGKLQQGKISNINFKEIENYAKEQGAYTVVKSVSKIITEEATLNIEVEDVDKLEEKIIENYIKENPSKFDSFIFSLISALSIEKQEDETSTVFNSRLIAELNKILNL